MSWAPSPTRLKGIPPFKLQFIDLASKKGVKAEFLLGDITKLKLNKKVDFENPDIIIVVNLIGKSNVKIQINFRKN